MPFQNRRDIAIGRFRSLRGVHSAQQSLFPIPVDQRLGLVVEDLQSISDHGLLVVVPLIKLPAAGRAAVPVPVQGQEVEDRPAGAAGPPV